MKPLEKLSLMAIAAGTNIPQELVPKADCNQCQYQATQDKNDHCYMFHEAPGERCGQFEVNRHPPA